MKRFLKRFFLFLFITIIVLLGLSFAVAAIFEKQIGERIVRALNQQLTTELTVESMDMTVLRTFPALSADLQNVQLQGTDDQVLLEAGTLSFRFGLLSILSRKYKVKSVKVSDGALHVSLDRNGRPNYLVYEADSTSAATSSSNNTVVNLEQALLSNIEVLYTDLQTEQYMNVLVEEARFSGNFTGEKFDVESDASMVSRFYEAGGTRYLVGRPIDYDAIVQVDLAEGVYRLQEIRTNISGNEFVISGATEDWEGGLYYDLLVTNGEGNLEGVLQLLPASYSRSLGKFSSKGAFAFEATVKGPMGKDVQPEIKANLQLKNGRLQHPDMPADFKGVSFDASFTNGTKRSAATSEFRIDNFAGNINRQLTEMQLAVTNLDDPQIDFILDGALPIGAVYGLLGSPDITDGSGEVEIQDMRIQGRYQDMLRTSRISRVKAGGRLEFDDASLVMNGERLVFDRGVMDLKGNQLIVDNLRLTGADSDLQFSGTAFNVLPVLFADSVNTQQAFLEFQANLDGKQVDIGKLLTAFDLKVAAQDTTQLDARDIDSLKTTTIENQRRLTALLKGRFETNVEAFNYQQITGKNFSGQLDFSTSQIVIKGKTDLMEGSLELDGRLYFFRDPSLEAKLTGNGIDIKTLFAQTKNFGQEVLTAKNISGTMSAKTMIYAFWDQQGNFRDDRLRVLSAVAIENGALTDFELMERFSTFVNVKDLQNIKFTQLDNFLEITNNRLYLPAMFIRSNALNLTVSGEHDFSNNFDYNIQVNAGQVVANRFKAHDPSLRPVEAKRKGFFNLYYRVFGDIDSYEFASAKQQVQGDFLRSQYRKREIERSLEQVFGPLELVSEPAEWRDAELPEEAEYMDFEVKTDTVEKSTVETDTMATDTVRTQPVPVDTTGSGS